jgi:2-polyprenyl-3-methyl-5-hydroxy-6-metoxy-1,4-benzoquinol methylase
MQINLLKQFGDIDVYLFDQLLRGRIEPGMRVLDAGCGGGRNLVYLLREGYAVYGADQDPEAVEQVRRMASRLAPSLPARNFQTATLEAMPFDDGCFDVVICSAVLHFAANDRQFRAMLDGVWKKLRRGGMLFCRLASSIGIEKEIQKIDGRRYWLPDGSERYLVDAAMLETLTVELGAVLLDQIKTTVVQNQRSMTTWVMRKT